jgi:multimeric flavodoxin WrbA
VKRAMLAADGVVMASPNYINSVTAQMKALFDRCACPLHCQAFEGRYGAAVVTSGGPGSDEVEQYILRFLRSLGCWTVGSIGAEARDVADEKTRVKALAASRDLGKKLAEAVRNAETYPEQTQARQGFFQRMKMLVALHKEDWPYEYKFWKSMGRL